MSKQWTKVELIKLFELLIENNAAALQKQGFRKYLNRDENLFANQSVREAHGNIAYRSVNFEVPDGMSNEAFWSKIDKTPYNDLIEDNAAVAILKMAEKLRLLN